MDRNEGTGDVDMVGVDRYPRRARTPAALGMSMAARRGHLHIVLTLDGINRLPWWPAAEIRAVCQSSISRAMASGA